MPGTKREAKRHVMGSAKGGQNKRDVPTNDLRSMKRGSKSKQSPLELQKSSEESAEVQAMAAKIMAMAMGAKAKKPQAPSKKERTTSVSSTSHCSNHGCNKDGSADTKLKLCSRCGKAAYCTAACQKQDWFNGHKHVCGKKLEVGETFFLKLLASQPELNGRKVTIKEAINEKGLLLVSIDEGKETEGGDKAKETTTVVVEPKNLGTKKSNSG